MNGVAELSAMAKKRGRPKKPGGDGAQVRIEADLASMARYIAARKGSKTIDLLSAILRPALEREFGKLAPKIGEVEE